MDKFKVYDVSAFRETPLLLLLKQFHDKFGTPYDGEPRMLGKAELAFRLVCHDEEAQEYLDAVSEDDLVDAIDALGDEIYFLAGTAHRQGFMDLEPMPSIPMPPRETVGLLPAATMELRKYRHKQVLDNYALLARTEQPIWRQRLALKEALDCFYRTAAMHGFDIQEALLRIHAANMAKDVDPTKQRRTKALAAEGIDAAPMLEITKPNDWLAPYLGDLVGEGEFQVQDSRAVEEALKEIAAEDFPTIERGFMRMTSGQHKNLCGLVTIDGPDASGKTTLAQRIAEVTGGQVVHLTWSPQLEAVMCQYRFAAIDYAKVLARHCVVVLERPWLSHPIYAEVYRGGEYNAVDVHDWKLEVETAALLNIIALPGDTDAWFANYKSMCETRVELHGPAESKARAVADGFRDAFSGAAGAARQPQGVLEVYDYQLYPTPVDIDTFISKHVIPLLKEKV